MVVNTPKEIKEVSLQGEVVEVLEEGTHRVTKINVNPFYLSIPDVCDAHLGEIVTIEVKITINSLHQTFNTRRLV
jgi:hypothetical protein